jgi:zinc transport system ATP-binding protein
MIPREALTTTTGDRLATLRDVAVTLGGREVLRDVSLSVHRGEVVTLIGPNGAGKTTLVKALLGLVPLSRGSVTWAPGLRVGYVPQKLKVDPVLPLTVGRLMTLTQRASRQRVLEALAETGVEHLIGASVDGLSGGEFQRVLLARALLRRPDLLVLDEPAQGVDHLGEAALYELIDRVRKEHHCGVLMISHDLHVVMGSTDRVFCINGHVCCTGAPQAVAGDPAFHDLFGAQARAFALYTHHHDHAHDPLSELGAGSGQHVGCGHDAEHHGHSHHQGETAALDRRKEPGHVG